MTDASGAEIIWLDGAEAETNGVPVDAVLDGAKDECEEVVVIGYVKGRPNHLYMAASFGERSAEQTIWLMKLAEKWLLEGCPAVED